MHASTCLLGMRSYYVYIMASRTKVLYVGVSNDLSRRVAEHKRRQKPGFTREYWANRLVFYERHRYVLNAIEREKEIKKWSRQKKTTLIEDTNSGWEDLQPPRPWPSSGTS
ncbi:MAG TPA: GIY-YIG nuclease family protein [Rhodothermales bacterium]|nr:GIY-YIG nuclease family protein [Rhodothermales bacterium]